MGHSLQCLPRRVVHASNSLGARGVGKEYGVMQYGKFAGITLSLRPLLASIALPLLLSGSASANHDCDPRDPPPPPPVVNSSFDNDGTGVASPAGWVSSGASNADFTETGG